ncbi:MAG: hypothetical protein IPM98_10380 [Lewinellaceae bacterium]|nr:hypothetical protein [Lewinellaceae bacterium]
MSIATHTAHAGHSVLRLIALALPAHIALSWSLWYGGGGRTFPLLPLWGPAYLPVDFWLEGVQIAAFLLLTLTIGIFPQKKYAAHALGGALLWMIAQDLNRLQPWSYFYLLALGLLLCSSCGAGAVRSLRWLLAAVYAWGGLNKITPYFAEDNFPWFCEAFVWTKPLGAFPALGYAVAAGELLLAPGLLWGVSRPVFRWLAVGFHLVIIAALSPWGLDWNAVVIPWNIAMAAMVWVLFSKKTPDTDGRVPHPGGRTRLLFLGKSTLFALAWLMPLFNIVHCWDEPLSWKMYSNTQTEAGFYIENGMPCPDLQVVWEQHAFDAGTQLLFDDWAFADLHVPAYNSPRTHQRLAQYLCPCASAPVQAGLWQLTVQRWDRTGEIRKKIPCRALIR